MWIALLVKICVDVSLGVVVDVSPNIEFPGRAGLALFVTTATPCIWRVLWLIDWYGQGSTSRTINRNTRNPVSHLPTTMRNRHRAQQPEPLKTTSKIIYTASSLPDRIQSPGSNNFLRTILLLRPRLYHWIIMAAWEWSRSFSSLKNTPMGLVCQTLQDWKL